MLSLFHGVPSTHPHAQFGCGWTWSGITLGEHVPDLRDCGLPGFLLSLADGIDLVDGFGGDPLRLQELLQGG
jgi:hypothetical protein